MRRLHVDLEELLFAFDNSDYEASYYLDLETGKVELITADIRFVAALFATSRTC